MRRFLQIGLLVSAVAVALALTVLAEARIVPEERRVGQVELFMSEKTVRNKLGPPDRVKHVEFESRADVRRLIYRDRKLRLDFSPDSRLVHEISTKNPRQRTRAGSGVGSTRRELLQAEDERLHCEQHRVEGDCWIQPRGRHSAYYTYFLIEKSRVVEVVIRDAGAPL